MRGVKFGKSVSSNTEGEIEILLLEFAFGVRGREGLQKHDFDLLNQINVSVYHTQ